METNNSSSRIQELKDSMEKVAQLFQNKNKRLSLVEKGAMQKILSGEVSIKNYSKNNKAKISKMYPRTIEMQCKLLRKSLFYIKHRMNKIKEELSALTKNEGSTAQASPSAP